MLHPPWYFGRYLWIEVRCSGGDGKGDPDNVCRDKTPDDGTCPSPPGTQPPTGEKSNMEAYSDNSGDGQRYSRITFCNRFFNDLKSLQEAIDYGKKQSQAVQNNLETWNNRARCFFHEITHLDYFMNAPKSSPSVDDLKIRYKKGGIPDWYDAYGPYNAKVLRNYVGDGFYTQRNADSYAYFALANYVEQEIGRYPSDPSPGTFKPMEAPKNSKGKPIEVNHVDTGVGEDLIGTTESGPDSKTTAPGFQTPGCGDRDPSKPDVQANVTPLNPKCDDKNSLSKVPYNVFSGPSGSVYDNFCNAADGNKRKLSWIFDAHGNLKTTPTRRRKRTPPPNPDAYQSYNFELDWTPNTNFDTAACSSSCADAYAAIAKSPCGYQGGDQNIMTVAGSVDVGCGTYGYTITGPDVPKPQDPPTPFLSAQYCYPSDAFGSHGDIQPSWQAEYLGEACAGTALHSIKKGDKSTYIHWSTTTNGVPYNYNVYWQDGCDSSVTEMNLWKPMADNDATCISLFQGDYQNCNNGGIGGSISAGCVVYEFKAKLD